MPPILVFIYLQLLDFLTTLAGFRIGASEASPFIVKLIQAVGPVMGVAASKAVALVIAAACVGLNRGRLIVWANYWYAALIAWNLYVLILAGGHLPH
jgi:hypothetical protein